MAAGPAGLRLSRSNSRIVHECPKMAAGPAGLRLIYPVAFKLFKTSENGRWTSGVKTYVKCFCCAGTLSPKMAAGPAGLRPGRQPLRADTQQSENGRWTSGVKTFVGAYKKINNMSENGRWTSGVKTIPCILYRYSVFWSENGRWTSGVKTNSVGFNVCFVDGPKMAAGPAGLRQNGAFQSEGLSSVRKWPLDQRG